MFVNVTLEARLRHVCRWQCIWTHHPKYPRGTSQTRCHFAVRKCPEAPGLGGDKTGSASRDQDSLLCFVLAFGQSRPTRVGENTHTKEDEARAFARHVLKFNGELQCHLRMRRDSPFRSGTLYQSSYEMSVARLARPSESQANCAVHSDLKSELPVDFRVAQLLCHFAP